MMIASSPVPPTISIDSEKLASRGAAPTAISPTAVDSNPGSTRTVSGVGMTHSSPVARRKTSIMKTTQTNTSTRLTATGDSRYLRAMKPAAKTTTTTTTAPTSQLLARTTRIRGSSAANTAASTPMVNVSSAPRRAGRSSEGMAHRRTA